MNFVIILLAHPWDFNSTAVSRGTNGIERNAVI